MDSTNSTQNNGIALIAAERQRQLSVEGWTPEHDETHEHGELANAAAVYASCMGSRRHFRLLSKLWPWDVQWYKPTPLDRVRELEKAGALIAAEIDRLLRQGPSVSDGGSSDASRVSLEKQIESLLAACKAKDEALNMWMIGEAFVLNGNQLASAASAYTEAVRLTKIALALQPDSSVKPDFQTSEGDKSITIRAQP